MQSKMHNNWFSMSKNEANEKFSALLGGHNFKIFKSSLTATLSKISVFGFSIHFYFMCLVYNIDNKSRVWEILSSIALSRIVGLQ